MSTNSSTKKGIFSWLGVTDKVLSALFYAVSSIAVIFVNKCILSVYDFPHFDFIALMQFASTSAIILILVFLKKVEVPALNWSIFKEIFPISVMFLGNVVCGLGSTRSLSLPMLTALRRFSILMTMLAEWFILNNKPSNPVMWSVIGMVLGALLAAYYDFSYDSTGYSLVFMNNIFTALNGVWTKRASLSGRCSKMALLFYNSLFSAILLSIFFISEDFSASQSLNRPSLFFSSLRPTSLSPTTVSNNHLVMMDLDHLYSQSANNVVKDSPNHLRSLSPLTVSSSNQNRRLDSVYVSWGSHWLRRLHESTTFTDNTNSNNNNNNNNNNIMNNAVNNNNAINNNNGSPNSNSASTDSSTSTTTTTAAAKSSTLYSVYHFPHWNEPQLVLLSLLASLLGSVLNYSIFLCTAHNSALTTSVIGCLKNVITTYLGMLLYADYVFNPMNFLGVNISIAASLYYTYVTLFKGMGGYGGG